MNNEIKNTEMSTEEMENTAGGFITATEMMRTTGTHKESAALTWFMNLFN